MVVLLPNTPTPSASSQTRPTKKASASGVEHAISTHHAFHRPGRPPPRPITGSAISALTCSQVSTDASIQRC